MRRPPAVLLLALLAVPSESRADGSADCDSAYERGQELRRAGKLVKARAEFELCSQKVCAPFEIADCTRWLHEVEAATPATPPSPPPPPTTTTTATTPPQATQDAPSAGSVAPHPLAHEQPLESRPPPPSAPRPPVVAYWLGGVGLTAVVVGAIIDAKGYFVDTAALSHCPSGCDDSKINATRTELLVGDITLGVGVVLVGVAIWLYLESRTADHASTTSRVAADPGGVQFVF